MKNKGTGFKLVLAACVLALVGVIVYTRVMYTTPAVFVSLIIAIVLVIVDLAVNNKILSDWVPIAAAMLLGFGLATSFSVMVNQIGYVVSGLDQMNTLTSFIVFVVIAAIAMILAIVSSFLKQTKSEA